MKTLCASGDGYELEARPIAVDATRFAVAIQDESGGMRGLVHLNLAGAEALGREIAAFLRSQVPEQTPEEEAHQGFDGPIDAWCSSLDRTPDSYGYRWLCTRKQGHSGDHVGSDGTGCHGIHRWPR